uniref:Myozenin 1 n=1 Tax=Myripristis murdjan TaxID=586833 RepID=A0A667YVR5_9TELE
MDFDLGTKIRTPKDIMLEELSLMKNRGSKMFKMRQQRVEKFIYENNPDIFTSDSMQNALQSECQIMLSAINSIMPFPLVMNLPFTGGAADQKSKKEIHVKTYVSPWEKAMKGDENLVATLKASMPGPIVHIDLPKYKCFNRTAMPFGGYEKANQLLKFQLPTSEETKEEPEPAVVYQQDIGCRPSFNRTPIGWVGSSEPSSIHMETDTVPFDGETDEL